MISTRAFKVEDVQESKRILLSVLDSQLGPAFDIVVLNAGAALYASDMVNSIQEGIDLATETIRSGAAKEKMLQFVQATQTLGANNV
jgi:anthranilate phosphoribosyltransferase